MSGVYNTIAILPLNGTTITATAVPSTFGAAVVDGTTISFRQPGITLSNGQVFSLGYGGLVDASTTAEYQVVTGTAPAVASSATPTGAMNATLPGGMTGNATLAIASGNSSTALSTGAMQTTLTGTMTTTTMVTTGATSTDSSPTSSSSTSAKSDAVAMQAEKAGTLKIALVALALTAMLAL